MDRGVGTEFFLHPEAHFFHCCEVIILGRDDKVRNFNVDFFLLQDFECFKDRCKFTITQFAIKVFCKALEINVCCIHDSAKLSERGRVNEPVGMANVKKAFLPNEKTNVQHIFVKDRGLDICVGDRASACLFGLVNDEFWRNIVTEDILR